MIYSEAELFKMAKAIVTTVINNHYQGSEQIDAAAASMVRLVVAQRQAAVAEAQS